MHNGNMIHNLMLGARNLNHWATAASQRMPSTHYVFWNGQPLGPIITLHGLTMIMGNEAELQDHNDRIFLQSPYTNCLTLWNLNGTFRSAEPGSTDKAKSLMLYRHGAAKWLSEKQQFVRKVKLIYINHPFQKPNKRISMMAPNNYKQHGNSIHTN